MRIGIVISSSLKQRIGVEEYCYQLLKHLPMVDDYKNHQFFIYTPRSCSGQAVEILKWPFKFGWTQIRLSWEMLRNKLDVLFVPAHTYPIIHPKKIVVAIQGLEFEAAPKTYGFIKRKVLRFLTKRNAKKADRIIVPSQTTKNDLIKFYKVNPEKISIIPHGISGYEIQDTRYKIQKKYILYLGSGHKRKNIGGLKEAYKILKKEYKIPHKLILAGVKNVGSPTSNIEMDFKGYVDEKEKWQLLRNADVFVFPSFYEGFGFPVLEAQKMGVPVVASNTGALPEILQDSALLVNPEKPEEVVEAIYKIIKNEKLRKELVKRGYKNVKRFNWLNCAAKTLFVILNS